MTRHLRGQPVNTIPRSGYKNRSTSTRGWSILCLRNQKSNLRRDKHSSGIKSDIRCLHMLKCMLLRPVVRSSYKGRRRIGREIIRTVIAKPHFGLVRIRKVEERAHHGHLVAAHHLPLRIRMVCFQTVDKMRNLYPRSLAISLRNRKMRELTKDLQERGIRWTSAGQLAQMNRLSSWSNVDAVVVSGPRCSSWRRACTASAPRSRNSSSFFIFQAWQAPRPM